MEPKYQGSNMSRDERPVTSLVPKPPRPPGFNTDEEWDGFKSQVQRAHVSQLLPKNMSVEQALVIACKGRELQMPPLYALSQLVVINGKVGMQAECMRALVYRSFPDAHIVIKTPVDQRNQQCVLEVARTKDAPKQEFGFTIDDAVQAGLVGRDAKGKLTVVGGKYPWVQYPADMLFARAASRAIRAVWPEVVMGAGYTPDELTDASRGTESQSARELDAAFTAPDEPQAIAPAKEPAKVVDLDAAFTEAPEPEKITIKDLERAKDTLVNDMTPKPIVTEPPPAAVETAPDVPKAAEPPGEYVIKYGRLTGKKCKDVSKVSLESYCKYLSGLVKTKTGETDEAVEETVNNIRAYLAQT